MNHIFQTVLGAHTCRMCDDLHAREADPSRLPSEPIATAGSPSGKANQLAMWADGLADPVGSFKLKLERARTAAPL